MGKRAWSILMGIGSIALIFVLFISYMNSDNTPPKLVIQDVDLSYYDGITPAELLVGVSAYDDVDRDLTSKIFVDQVIVDASTGEVIVVYGVQDCAQNVTTGRRTISYAGATSNTSSAEAPEGTSASEEGAPEEGEAVSTEASVVGQTAAPSISLTDASATIKKGEAFIPTQYVAGVSDDADDEETLMQHIHVDGNYDAKTAGTYDLLIYVTDTEGNASEKQAFTLNVE